MNSPSPLAEVRRRAVAGETMPAIAREMNLPLDLVEQMVGHWQRLGKLVVVGGGPSSAPASCQERDPLACAGCFFARACPSR